MKSVENAQLSLFFVGPRAGVIGCGFPGAQGSALLGAALWLLGSCAAVAAQSLALGTPPRARGDSSRDAHEIHGFLSNLNSYLVSDPTESDRL